jgi:hypothetical protein
LPLEQADATPRAQLYRRACFQQSEIADSDQTPVNSCSVKLSAFTSAKSVNDSERTEHLGCRDIVSTTWSLQMTQALVVTVSLLLFASGVLANVGGGSLYQNTGAWVSHNTK